MQLLNIFVGQQFVPRPALDLLRKGPQYLHHLLLIGEQRIDLRAGQPYSQVDREAYHDQETYYEQDSRKRLIPFLLLSKKEKGPATENIPGDRPQKAGEKGIQFFEEQ